MKISLTVDITDYPVEIQCDVNQIMEDAIGKLNKIKFTKIPVMVAYEYRVDGEEE